MKGGPNTGWRPVNLQISLIYIARKMILLTMSMGYSLIKLLLANFNDNIWGCNFFSCLLLVTYEWSRDWSWIFFAQTQTTKQLYVDQESSGVVKQDKTRTEKRRKKLLGSQTCHRNVKKRWCKSQGDDDGGGDTEERKVQVRRTTRFNPVDCFSI